MFKTRIDNLYNLCKRVINEHPDMYCAFDLTTHGLHVRLYKDKNNVGKQDPDLSGDIYTNPQILETENERNYQKIEKTLLEVLEEKEKADEIN